jgi:hypothetical protein
MAFIRRRTTASGGLSTTLVEAYRDASGKPRQRVLANMYGAGTSLEALARLAALRERLRKEKAQLESEIEATSAVYRAITTMSLHGHQFPPAERKGVDQFLSSRNHVVKRLKKVDAALARIQKDGTAIKKHCNASPNEIQRAIRQYKKQLDEAEAVVFGAAGMLACAKEELRRLSPFDAEDVYKGAQRFLRDIPL